MTKLTLAQWIDDCKAVVRSDHDNLMLFTGVEGAGKSTWKFQVLKALDPDFSVDRIHFSIPRFIADAPHTPRYGARDLDELFGSGRMAMHRESIHLNKHLQICRQYNHHMGVAFPRVRRLDGTIAERVRWRWDIPKRGIAVLLKPVEHVWHSRTKGELVTLHWTKVLRCSFRPNGGRDWRAYLAKKAAEGNAQSMAALEDDAMPADVLSAGGGDLVEEAAAFFGQRLAARNEHAGPAASIREVPEA